MLTIVSDKIYLREFVRDNIYDEKYYIWLRDAEVIKSINRIEYLMSMEFSEIEQYVSNILKSTTDSYFAIYAKENDEFIGTFKVGHINWRSGLADIGIMIGEKNYWGKGYAKDVLKVGCSYAFNYLSLRKLTGGTIATNIGMCKAFEHVGFIREGLLKSQYLVEGEYVDHVIFGMFKEDMQK